MALPWKLHGDGKKVGARDIVLPGERLTWPRTIGLGAQHVVAMFGATFLVPLLTGFPPATTLLFSGVGTLLFVVTGVLLAVVGLIVIATGTGWIDGLMPPVVAGAIVALIGFNLAPAAKNNFMLAPLTATITLAAVLIASVAFRGLLGRMSILVGVVVGYIAAIIQQEVDF